MKVGRSSYAVSTVKSDVVDHQTGEVTSTTITTASNREVEPPFVKMYVQDVGKLMDLSPAGSKVLHILVKSMNYYNVVTMLKPIKEMMCQELGITLKTFNNQIDDLYQKGVLIRKARAVYIIDPELFGKGRWENVKRIRMVVDYDANGNKFINTELVKQLEIDF